MKAKRRFEKNEILYKSFKVHYIFGSLKDRKRDFEWTDNSEEIETSSQMIQFISKRKFHYGISFLIFYFKCSCVVNDYIILIKFYFFSFSQMYKCSKFFFIIFFLQFLFYFTYSCFTIPKSFQFDFFQLLFIVYFLISFHVSLQLTVTKVFLKWKSVNSYYNQFFLSVHFLSLFNDLS